MRFFIVLSIFVVIINQSFMADVSITEKAFYTFIMIVGAALAALEDIAIIEHFNGNK